MRALRFALVLVATLVVSLAAWAAQPKKNPPLPSAKAQVADSQMSLDARDGGRKAAEEYLKAISHQGNDGAIESLLGGATLTARLFTIENWKIVGREKHRHEVGEVGDLNAYVAAIDKAGREALSTMIGGGPASEDPDGLGVQEISEEDAKKILEPTRLKSEAFSKSHPVFAYVARVDKQVYWHPKNPFRKLLADAGPKGKYTLELDLFWVETIEGAHEDKNTRKWPLRIVRWQCNGTDSGMKVLPASDWNAE
ncbi:MAG: hypothetical protein HY901_29050 [Deltaproteobacteria bacterium]|nr:hypothetical protein [Deltaproteobacteria bacterium]